MQNRVAYAAPPLGSGFFNGTLTPGLRRNSIRELLDSPRESRHSESGEIRSGQI